MKKIFLSFALLIIFSANNVVLSQSFPKHKGLVTDEANLFSSEQVDILERKLRDYENKTSIEIAVVTVDSMGGYEVEDYSNNLFNTWGIGKKGMNNGLLLLIAMNERKFRVEVGYGLEEYITDGYSKLMAEKHIKQNFKNKTYYTGINSIINEFITKIGPETVKQRQEYKALLEKRQKEAEKEAFNNFLNICFYLLILSGIGFVIYYLIRQKQLKTKENEYKELIKKVYYDKIKKIRIDLETLVQEKFLNAEFILTEVKKHIVVLLNYNKNSGSSEEMESFFKTYFNKIESTIQTIFKDRDTRKNINSFDDEYESKISYIINRSNQISSSISNVINKYGNGLFKGVDYKNYSSYVERQLQESKHNLEESKMLIEEQIYDRANEFYNLSLKNLKNIQEVSESINKIILEISTAEAFNVDVIKKLSNIVGEYEIDILRYDSSEDTKEYFRKVKIKSDNFLKEDHFKTDNPLETKKSIDCIIEELDIIKKHAKKIYDRKVENNRQSATRRNTFAYVAASSYNNDDDDRRRSNNSNDDSSSSSSSFDYGGGSSGGGGSSTDF